MQNSLDVVLEQSGIRHSWVDHAPAYCAASSLKVLNRWGAPVLKTILVHLPTGPALVVIPASMRLDMVRLEKIAAGPVRLGTSQEAWLLFPDCEFGAVPPIGKQYRIPSLWDASLLSLPQVMVRGNTSMRSFLVNPIDLAKIDDPVLVDGLATLITRSPVSNSA
ncbi:MAG: aminoacyl-tRNA deacylase [Gemmataceae bacterium]